MFIRMKEKWGLLFFGFFHHNLFLECSCLIYFPLPKRDEAFGLLHSPMPRGHDWHLAQVKDYLWKLDMSEQTGDYLLLTLQMSSFGKRSARGPWGSYRAKMYFSYSPDGVSL